MGRRKCVPTTGNHEYKISTKCRNKKIINQFLQQPKNVSVSKARLSVTMKSEIAEQNGGRQVTLSASVP